jgi:hypothetical protein
LAAEAARNLHPAPLSPARPRLQGQEVSAELHQQLSRLRQQLAAQVVHMEGTPLELVRPYGDTLQRCRQADPAKAADECRMEVKQRTGGLVPQVGCGAPGLPWVMADRQQVVWGLGPCRLAPGLGASCHSHAARRPALQTHYTSLDTSVRRAVAQLLESQLVLPGGQVALALPDELPIYSRAALSALGGWPGGQHPPGLLLPIVELPPPPPPPLSPLLLAAMHCCSASRASHALAVIAGRASCTG